MKAWEELDLFGIERCPECRCAVGTDWGYRDYSSKTIAVCPQCGHLVYLDDEEVE